MIRGRGRERKGEGRGGRRRGRRRGRRGRRERRGRRKSASALVFLVKALQGLTTQQHSTREQT
jgi:hypothetical protein